MLFEKLKNSLIWLIGLEIDEVRLLFGKGACLDFVIGKEGLLNSSESFRLFLTNTSHVCTGVSPSIRYALSETKSLSMLNIYLFMPKIFTLFTYLQLFFWGQFPATGYLVM